MTNGGSQATKLELMKLCDVWSTLEPDIVEINEEMENINSSIRKIRDGPLSQYRTALTETISGSNDKFLNTVKSFEILNEQMKGHKKLRSELKDKMLTRKFQL